LVESTNETERRAAVVPEVCEAHVEPPFAEWRIFPASPTTQPLFALAKDTEFRRAVVPDV
jgi:hypothetical protein